MPCCGSTTTPSRTVSVRSHSEGRTGSLPAASGAVERLPASTASRRVAICSTCPSIDTSTSCSAGSPTIAGSTPAHSRRRAARRPSPMSSVLILPPSRPPRRCRRCSNSRSEPPARPRPNRPPSRLAGRAHCCDGIQWAPAARQGASLQVRGRLRSNLHARRKLALLHYSWGVLG